MNDVVKLSELIFGNTYGSKLDFEESVYDLYELAKGLRAYYEQLGRVMLPANVLWVGGGDSPIKSVRNYKVSYAGLENYLNNLCGPVSESGCDFIPSYCETDATVRDVPVNLIYVSLSELEKLILEAGVKHWAPVSKAKMIVSVQAKTSGEELRQIELNKVSVIINGLISLVKEVGKAYSDNHLGDVEKRRADSIKSTVRNINKATRKDFDICNALKLLADDAGVDMRVDLQTFKKYKAGGAKVKS